MTDYGDWKQVFDPTVALSDGRYYRSGLANDRLWYEGGKWIVRATSFSGLTTGIGRTAIIWSTSLDSPSWNPKEPAGFSESYTGCAYGEGVWMLATGRTRPAGTWTSADLATWTSRNTIPLYSGGGTDSGTLLFVNGTWVFLQPSGTTQGGSVYTTSTYTGSWSRVIDFRTTAGDTTGTGMSAIKVGDVVAVVATGDSTTRLWYSDDPSDAASWDYSEIVNSAIGALGIGLAAQRPVALGVSDEGVFVCGSDKKVYMADSVEGPWSVAADLSTVDGASIASIQFLAYNDAAGWLMRAVIGASSQRLYSGDTLDDLSRETDPGNSLGQTFATDEEKWLIGTANNPGLYAREGSRASGDGWGVVL